LSEAKVWKVASDDFYKMHQKLSVVTLELLHSVFLIQACQGLFIWSYLFCHS